MANHAIRACIFGLSIYFMAAIGCRESVFVGNPSGSFLYVISGLHGVHIFAGIAFLLAALIGVYRNIAQVKNVLRLELASIFWHFLDILWIYLYVFYF